MVPDGPIALTNNESEPLVPLEVELYPAGDIGTLMQQTRRPNACRGLFRLQMQRR